MKFSFVYKFDIVYWNQLIVDHDIEMTILV